MQQSSHNSNTPKIVGAIAISAVLLIGVYVFLTKDLKATKGVAGKTGSTVSSVSADSTSSVQQTSSASSSPPSVDTTSSNASSSSSASSYKDGTYKATAEYYVPHGSNSITVNLTIKDGSISKVSATHDYNDRESGMYVDSFDSSISSKAVGQKINGLSLSRVGGASLTTDAFDEAISAIASQAKA